MTLKFFEINYNYKLNIFRSILEESGEDSIPNYKGPSRPTVTTHDLRQLMEGSNGNGCAKSKMGNRTFFH